MLKWFAIWAIAVVIILVWNHAAHMNDED